MGSNYKSYKHKYYLAIYRGNKEDKGQYQKTEVSNMKWLTYDQVLKHIRPYNNELINIVKKVNKLIKDYAIV